MTVFVSHCGLTSIGNARYKYIYASNHTSQAMTTLGSKKGLNKPLSFLIPNRPDFVRDSAVNFMMSHRYAMHYEKCGVKLGGIAVCSRVIQFNQILQQFNIVSVNPIAIIFWYLQYKTCPLNPLKVTSWKITTITAAATNAHYFLWVVC